MSRRKQPKHKLGAHVRLDPDWMQQYGGRRVFACSTGVVRSVEYKYMGTALECIHYEIIFDEPLFKRPMYENVERLTLTEDHLKPAV